MLIETMWTCCTIGAAEVKTTPHSSLKFTLPKIRRLLFIITILLILISETLLSILPPASPNPPSLSFSFFLFLFFSLTFTQSLSLSSSLFFPVRKISLSQKVLRGKVVAVRDILFFLINIICLHHYHHRKCCLCFPTSLRLSLVPICFISLSRLTSLSRNVNVSLTLYGPQPAAVVTQSVSSKSKLRTPCSATFLPMEYEC